MARIDVSQVNNTESLRDQVFATEEPNLVAPKEQEQQTISNPVNLDNSSFKRFENERKYASSSQGIADAYVERTRKKGYANIRKQDLSRLKEDLPMEYLPKEPEDIFQAAFGDYGKFVSDLTIESGEAAMSALGGVTDALEEGLNFGLEAVNLSSNAIKSLLGKKGEELKPEELYNFSEKFFPRSDDFGDRLLRGAVSILLPFAGISKSLKGVQILRNGGNIVSSMKRGMTAGALTNFAFVDPNDESLAKVAQEQLGFNNELINYIAHDGKEGSVWERRFKNAVEGAFIDLPFEVGLGFFSAVRAKKTLKYLKSHWAERDAILKQGGPEAIAKADEEIREALKEGLDPVYTVTDEAGKAVKKAKAKKTTTRQVTVKEGEEATKQTAKASANVLPDSLKRKLVNDIKPDFTSDFENTLKELAKEGPIVEKVTQKGDKILNVNLANIEDKSARELLKEMVKRNPDKFMQAKRGKMTMEQINELAIKKGFDAETVLSRNLGDVYNAEEIIAAGDVFSGALNRLSRLDSLVGKAKTADEKSLLGMQLESEFNKTLDIAVQLHGGTSEMGRAFNAIKGAFNSTTPKKFIESAANITRYSDDKAKAISIMLKTIKTPKNALTLSKFIKNNPNSSLSSIAMNVRINGLLSKITTQSINILGNSISIGSRIAETGLARGLSILRNQEADRIYKGEVGSLLMGLTESFKDATVIASRSFKAGRPIISGSKKAPIKMGTLSWDAVKNSSAADQGIYMTAKVLSDTVSLPTRGLLAMDEFFKTLNYRMSVRQRTLREAHELASKNNIVGKDFDKLYKRLLDNVSNETKLASIQDAEYFTFTKKLEGKSKLIADAVRSSAVTRFLFPFVNTNLNLVEYTLERTPLLNLMLPKVRTAIRQGGSDLDVMMGKTAFGGLIMSSGGYLAVNGLLTGRAPRDPSARAITGSSYREYTIRTGNADIPLNTLGPFGKILGLAADLSIISGFITEDNREEAEGLMTTGAFMVGQYMIPEFLTYSMGALNEFISSEGQDKSALRKIKQIAAQYPSQFVPFSGLLRGIRKKADPVKRSTTDDELNLFESAVAEFMNTIPGLSKELPPRRNIFGEELTYPAGWGPDLVSPFWKADLEKTKLQDELSRLGLMQRAGDLSLSDGEESVNVRYVSSIIRMMGYSVDLKSLGPQWYDVLTTKSAGVGLKGDFNPSKYLTKSRVINGTLKETLEYLADNNWEAGVSGNYIRIAPNETARDQRIKQYISEVISAFRQGARNEIKSMPSFQDAIKQKQEINARKLGF